MKVIILCGGHGIRLQGESTYIPKAMVSLGHRPLVWHVMKRYGFYGFHDFVLALGAKGDLVKDYFANYDIFANDLSVSLGKGTVKKLSHHQEKGWEVTLADTGETSYSGARIHRCRQYIGDEAMFMVSYADCLADIDIRALIAFHKKSKKIATITGAVPPYREGEFVVDAHRAVAVYDVKKASTAREQRFFNGGYMVFDRKIFPFLSSFSECKLETEVFMRLIADRQLAIYPHYGFWRWLDTDRDYLYLQDLVDKNQMYWLQEKGAESRV